jgi:hypothetical protein
MTDGRDALAARGVLAFCWGTAALVGLLVSPEAALVVFLGIVAVAMLAGAAMWVFEDKLPESRDKAIATLILLWVVPLGAVALIVGAWIAGFVGLGALSYVSGAHPPDVGNGLGGHLTLIGIGLVIFGALALAERLFD